MAIGEIVALQLAEGVNVSTPTGSNRPAIDIVYDGISAADKSVDISATAYSLLDARLMVWFLKKPAGGSTNGEQIIATITTPSATLVNISTGGFVMEAGTYSLLGT